MSPICPFFGVSKDCLTTNCRYYNAASGQCAFANIVVPANLAVTAVGAAGAAVTLTLPAVSGKYHAIMLIAITMYNTAARTGGATPVTVTTTNLPGTPAFTFPSAGAIGTITEEKFEPASPLRSSTVNTATTIVCPATTSVIWRVNVWYYLLPC